MKSPPTNSPDAEPAPDGKLSAADRAAINRKNALRSTGPRTAPGKARASLNAVRHSLTGQSLFVSEEDWNAYCLFALRLTQSAQPVGAMEEIVLQGIIDNLWRIHTADNQQTSSQALGVLHAYDRFEKEGIPFGPIQKIVAEIGALQDDARAPRFLMYLGLNRSRDVRSLQRQFDRFHLLQRDRHARAAQRLALVAKHGDAYDPQRHGPFQDDSFQLETCPAIDFYLSQLRPVPPVVLAPPRRPHRAKPPSGTADEK